MSESTTDEVAALRPNLLQRHDLVVVIAALALLAAGGLGYRSLTESKIVRFQKLGLSFDRRASWLPPAEIGPPTLRLTGPPGAPSGSATTASTPVIPSPTTVGIHTLYTSAADPYARLEVRIADRPRRFNVRGALGLERRARYGDLYWSASGDVVEIDGTEWLRTRFRYAYKAHENDSPRVATGIEYATLNGKLLYVVTLHGGERAAERLASEIAPSLTIDPSAPEVGSDPSPMRLSIGKTLPTGGNASMVNRVFPAAVMVVAIDVINGRLAPVAGGSGSIVADDGSVLTNYHVLFDKQRARLHDLFVIGRYRAPNREPEFVCAGRPTFSKLDPARDLALIKCDLDMNGHAFTPRAWPFVVARTEPVVPGESIYLVSYPDVGGGTIDVSVGRVNGFTGESGGAGDNFIRTDAKISPGSSGGAAVDEEGRLVGVPTAFRIRVADNGTTVVPLTKVGLVRPIDRAGPLLAVARKGWTPGEGESMVPSGEPTAGLEPGVQPDVLIGSKVLDAANDKPIAGAVVVVFKPGISSGQIDLDDLEDQSLTWAVTNESGEFTMPERVARGHKYTVAVMAKGYRALTADEILVLGADSPDMFDPWGDIRLERK